MGRLQLLMLSWLRVSSITGSRAATTIAVLGQALVLMVPSSGSAQAAIPAAEREALIALHTATDGNNWEESTNWLGDPGSECDWFGVVCDAGGGTVKELSLRSNQLVGPIPSELADLVNLTNLDLGQNELSGSVPTRLGQLANLEELGLFGNELSGPLPPELGNLENLEVLVLASNQFTGTLPPELGNLVNLEVLVLASNQFTGTLPPELGNLVNLTQLSLGNNRFEGSLPSELGNLANLERLFLNENQFRGTFPPELANLVNLTQLSLEDNRFEGPLPSELGNLVNLERLFLTDNRFEGPLPSELGNLVNLQQLFLSFNSLSGDVPESLQQLMSLRSNGLDLRFNRLTTSNLALADFLNTKQRGGLLWQSVQNVSAVYPQLGIGGGLTAVFFVTNSSEAAWSGSGYLDGGRWPGGQQWWLDGIEMTGASSFTLDLEPRQTRKLVFEGSEEQAVAGWLTLTADTGFDRNDVATAFFYNLVQEDRLIDSTGVTPAQPSRVFVIPVERTADGNTGMAFRNVVSQLELSLYDDSGNLIETARASNDAKFIDQFFTAVPEGFSGSVQAESSSSFFVTVLRLGFTDDGFQLTSIPATSVPSTSLF